MREGNCASRLRKDHNCRRILSTIPPPEPVRRQNSLHRFQQHYEPCILIDCVATAYISVMPSTPIVLLLPDPFFECETSTNFFRFRLCSFCFPFSIKFKCRLFIHENAEEAKAGRKFDQDRVHIFTSHAYAKRQCFVLGKTTEKHDPWKIQKMCGVWTELMATPGV